jgi:hypothetical protein
MNPRAKSGASALSRLCTALLCILSAGLTLAQEEQRQSEPTPALHSLSSRAELLLYGNTTDTWSRGVFNRVAQVADDSLNLEFRPDLDLSGDSLSTTLRPRFIASAQSDAQHSEAWLNEGWLRWRPVAGASLQAGREVLLWGPSAFWNPSNPFFRNNNKENPKREIIGHDFLRGRWQASEALSVSLISQLGPGHKPDTHAISARRRDAIKLDWIGSEASAAALVSAEPGKSLGWQGWAQWTASDALIVYGEAAWQRPQPYLQLQSDGKTWQRSDSHPYGLNAVLGAAYTFESNWTLNTEFWRNAAGLNDAESDALAASMATLATRTDPAAKGQLANLIQVSDPMSRHYVGLQLVNGGDAKTGWTLRYKHNLDDGSGEAFVMIRHDIGDRLQLWGNIMQRHGSHGDEYGRWVRSSAMLGLSWFLW